MFTSTHVTIQSLSLSPSLPSSCDLCPVHIILTYHQFRPYRINGQAYGTYTWVMFTLSHRIIWHFVCALALTLYNPLSIYCFIVRHCAVLYCLPLYSTLLNSTLLNSSPLYCTSVTLTALYWLYNTLYSQVALQYFLQVNQQGNHPAGLQASHLEHPLPSTVYRSASAYSRYRIPCNCNMIFKFTTVTSESMLPCVCCSLKFT